MTLINDRNELRQAGCMKAISNFVLMPAGYCYRTDQAVGETLQGMEISSFHLLYPDGLLLRIRPTAAGKIPSNVISFLIYAEDIHILAKPR